MNINKLFLFDFLTIKKIKHYLIVLFIFIAGAGYYKNSNPTLVLSNTVAANIGISIALFTTIYIIYTYTTLDKIKTYLMLPFKKWEVFYAYIFAIYFSLILQRLSFVIVVIVFFTKQPVLLVIYLILGSLLTTVVNVNLLLGLNKKNYLTIVTAVLSFILLYYFLTYGSSLIINLSIVSTLFLMNILTCLRFEPKNLAITRDIKAKKKQGLPLNYFLHVLIREKIMLVNIVVILGVILFYVLASPNNPVLLSVVWCFCAINTPLLTMFSGDKALARQEKMLPTSSKLMSGIYARFLFVYFVLINIYVLSLLYFIKGSFTLSLIIFVVVLIPIEVVVSLYLEKKHRIENWQTKQELWKNPRKYVLPMIVFLISVAFTFLSTGF